MSATFHNGELLAQEQAGMREKLAPLGPRLIRDGLTEQHQVFFSQLPFLLIGAVDEAGQPWASAVGNPPGFMVSPDTHTLRVGASIAQASPLHRCLVSGAPIGLLGIEPHTRRRNRANGIVHQVCDEGFVVHVQQSFGNCPKYIHARRATYAAPATSTATAQTVEQLKVLDAQARRIILDADTFFIATAHPHADGLHDARHGVDVSHRGGPHGFVSVDDDGTLSIPDFVGNSFFNTIGNIHLNPRAGLLFIDFESGGLLHLAVDADVVWNANMSNANVQATTRRLRFRVREIKRVRASLPLVWEREVK